MLAAPWILWSTEYSTGILGLITWSCYVADTADLRSLSNRWLWMEEWMLLRWDKLFISRRTRRTKTLFVYMFCSMMKFIRTTWKSTYTAEHQFVFRPISFHANWQSSRIFSHSLSPGTVAFKSQTMTTTTTNNEKALCKAKLGRVISPVCAEQTFRKSMEWGLEIFERHDWIFNIMPPWLVSALVLR